MAAGCAGRRVRAVKDAIPAQRGFAVQEGIDARKAIEAAGCDVVDLTQAERQAFQSAVQPIYGEARRQFGDAAFAPSRRMGRPRPSRRGLTPAPQDEAEWV